MRVFDYLPSPMSCGDQLRVYNAVMDLKQYARKIYKNGWEDALDAAFFHIINHYNPEYGELEHYAITIVKTIDLSKYQKESPSDDMVTIGLDEKSYIDHMADAIEEVEPSSDLVRCMYDLAPYFIKDFKFFCSKQSKDRKLKYTDIFKTYQPAVVGQAMVRLKGLYEDEVRTFLGYSKMTNIHSFDKDRYRKSIDESIIYAGKLNDTVLAKRKRGSHSKKIWQADLRKVLDLLYNTFYSVPDKYGCVEVEGRTFYMSISGKVVEGYETLMEMVETELVGSILSRTSLKVFLYEKGKELLLTSTKDDQYDVVLDLFGESIVVSFKLLAIKEV